jgi:predicted MFS family arabinose efflux permease
MLLFSVSTALAALGAFFQPAVSATVPDLVPKNKIPGAVSLMQGSFQGCMLLGQGTGGILNRLLGAPVLFMIDGLSFLVAATTDCMLTIPQTLPERKRGWKEQATAMRRDIAESFRYVWRKAGLRRLVLASMVQNFFTVPILVLLPFFVEDHLKRPSDWYGYLLASHGAGALIGLLAPGVLGLSPRARARSLIVTMILDAAGFALLAAVRDPWTAAALAGVGGALTGYTGVSIIAILQITTPSQLRGRVFGALGTLAGGLAPLAMGAGGVAADLLDRNVPLVYAGCGLAMLAVALWLPFNREYREFLASEAGSPAPDAAEAL